MNRKEREIGGPQRADSARVSGEFLQFDRERVRGVSRTIIDSLNITEGDKLFILYSPKGKQLEKAVREMAKGMGAKVKSMNNDQQRLADKLKQVDADVPETARKTAENEIRKTKWSTKLLAIICEENPEAMVDVNSKVREEYRKARGALGPIVAKKQWLIIQLPTEAEARIDNYTSHQEYLDLFFRACDRPWEEIEGAQKILIGEVLSPAKKLKFMVGGTLDSRWQTNLEMDMEEGQNWVNSTVQRNIPGSEVFSAPKQRTLKGRLALNYPVIFLGKVLPNLILEFENGRVVNNETYDENGLLDEKSMDWVKQGLATDEGASEVGEIALGTNNVLDRPFLNALLIEKVAGSFHVALGGCHPLTPNGVKSNIHVDLTCMMLPEFGGGEVYVDGKLIQENGRFLDPRLTVLNPR